MRLLADLANLQVNVINVTHDRSGKGSGCARWTSRSRARPAVPITVKRSRAGWSRSATLVHLSVQNGLAATISTVMVEPLGAS